MTKIYILLLIILFLSCERSDRAQLIRRQKGKITRVNRKEKRISPPKKQSIPKSKPTFEKSKTIIPMTKKNGIYTIPVKINGLELDFIFDTGASDIAISQNEADILIRKGTLTQDDIIGKGHYRIANGDVITAQIINLRTVQLGDKIIHNVRASVTPKIDAPLLLGQSALEKFGKVSIDYNEGIIILE